MYAERRKNMGSPRERLKSTPCVHGGGGGVSTAREWGEGAAVGPQGVRAGVHGWWVARLQALADLPLAGVAVELLHDRGRVVGLDLADLALEIGTSRTAEKAGEAHDRLLHFRWRQAPRRRGAAWRGLRVGAEGADFGCGASCVCGASCLCVGNLGNLGEERGGLDGKLGGGEDGCDGDMAVSGRGWLIAAREDKRDGDVTEGRL